MGSLGIQEMLVIAVLALFVFGPERLPEMARNAGQFLAKFRAETSKSLDELKRAANVEDLDRELKAIGREVRDVRSSVGRALSADPSLTAPTMAAAGTPRAEDDPPPMDGDAT